MPKVISKFQNEITIFNEIMLEIFKGRCPVNSRKVQHAENLAFNHNSKVPTNAVKLQKTGR